MTRHLVIIAVAIGTAGACRSQEISPPASSSAAPVAVDTARAQLRERPEVFEASGVVRGHTSATIASRIVAPVRAVLVKPGDRVQAGQPLVLLDDRDLVAVVRQTHARHLAAQQSLTAMRAEQAAVEASAALARASHTRIAALHDRKSATAQELDEARSTLRAAEARLTRASANIDEAQATIDAAHASAEGADVTASFARVTAPFDAVVTEKLVDPGTLVGPATPLLRLEDTRQFELEVRVDESRASALALEQRVPVRVEIGTRPADLEGRIVEIARAIDADTRTVLLTLGLTPAEGLRSGMFARARLPGATRGVLTVPERALVRHGQVTNVFVIEAGKARVRLVSVGRTDNDWIDVLAGLQDDETVIVAPPASLTDGVSVTPTTRERSVSGGSS